QPLPRSRPQHGQRNKVPLAGTILIAALTPGAFLQLAETKDTQPGKTGEMQMLEESREEIRKTVPENAQGVSRLRHELAFFWFCYVYDPIATGLRFVHLV